MASVALVTDIGRNGVTPVGQDKIEFMSDLLGGEKTVELITKNFPGISSDNLSNDFS